MALARFDAAFSSGFSTRTNHRNYLEQTWLNGYVVSQRSLKRVVARRGFCSFRVIAFGRLIWGLENRLTIRLVETSDFHRQIGDDECLVVN